MRLVPAIDIMKGKVVRLTKGLQEKMKTYDRLGDPIDVAKHWEKMGAEIIHIVDLDAALDKGSNLNLIIELANSINVRIQFGGGIRDKDLAEYILEHGIYRIILGSMAFFKPSSLPDLLERYDEERIAVALDYLGRQVMIRGWKDFTFINLDDAIAQFLSLGISTFLITSIAQDGTLEGPDFQTFERVRLNEKAEIIAAGGITSLKDLERLRSIGVNAAVIGKALYEGTIDLRKAKSIFENT